MVKGVDKTLKRNNEVVFLAADETNVIYKPFMFA